MGSSIAFLNQSVDRSLSTRLILLQTGKMSIHTRSAEKMGKKQSRFTVLDFRNQRTKELPTIYMISVFQFTC